MQSAVQAEKAALRRVFLQRRRAQDVADRRAQSAAIIAQLEGFAPYQQAASVMCYAAMADEVQTEEILARVLAAGKRLYLPYICDRAARRMRAAEVSAAGDLICGAFGIMTVREDRLRFADPAQLDLVLLPGVAFDSAGRRLGMGAGFYDRFLVPATRAVLAALAFSCQIAQRVPALSHDRALDYIITAEGIINCKTGKM